MQQRMHQLWLLLCFYCLSFSALALNGLLDIDQACAVQQGCFSGDSAGYPITINGAAGNSYRLTSDLIVPDENTDGIQVRSADISIDLNGFSIIRAACVGVSTSCVSASGIGSGVAVFSSTNFLGVSVKNGSIVGMGFHGVFLQSPNASATKLEVRWNRIDGIFTNSGAIITGNLALQNGRHGIQTNDGSRVAGNTVRENGGVGILADRGVMLQKNIADSNGGHGIDAGNGSGLQFNVVARNGGYGLNLTQSSAYRNNVITDNTLGTVNSGFNMFGNFCNTNTACP